MLVKGTQTEYVKVEIDDSTILEIILNKIRSACNIPMDTWINDEGELMEWEEFHTSHSWTVNTKLRDATDEDKAAFLVMKKIKELYKN